jgi:N-acetylglucosaminyl-diphospho-decaprenol L-rhamnosyltransferase
MGPVNANSNVSVVVVSYNTRDALRRCLGCIGTEHDVIVVDNASVDGSAEMVREEFPAVRLVGNVENVGFGAANNQGLELARRSLVLFLNSDCYASPGAISTLASVMADSSVVAAGGRLNNPDGSLQESVAAPLTLGAVFLEQSFLDRLLRGRGYWRTSRLDQAAAMIEVNQVMGACLMIRPLEKFDERFFLYVEDTDLCERLRRHGRILYVPGAVFTHDLGGSSVGVNRWRSVARYNRGKELFFALHRGPLACGLCWAMDRLGALLRLLIWGVPTILTLGLVPRFRNQAGLFIRVLTAPLRGPHRPTRSAG